MKVLAESPTYREYVDRLIVLRALIRDGKCDTEEADIVRDQMDKPWYEMNSEERDRADALSVDLSTLDTNSTIHHAQDGGILSEEMRGALGEPLRAQDWNVVLQLLRERPAEVSRELAAYLRGLCWIELGELEAGTLFLQFASQWSLLAPTRGSR